MRDLNPELEAAIQKFAEELPTYDKEDSIEAFSHLNKDSKFKGHKAVILPLNRWEVVIAAFLDMRDYLVNNDKSHEGQILLDVLEDIEAQWKE